MILRRLTKHVKDQNWFAVGLDFVIVVIGVGVALMGQQWLSDRQERADMRVAEAAVQIDLFTSYFSALERVAVADCRKEAYAAIAAQLLETGETWTPMPLVDETGSEGNVLPRVLRSPLKSWGSRNWDAGLARGTFNQMDDERRSAFDNLFQQTEYAAVTQSEIFTLQSRIKKLAVTTTISPDDRSRYYDILGELDDKSALLEMFSSGIIRQIGAIGFDLPDEFVSGELERLAGQNAFRETYFGACYVPMEFSLLSSNASEEEAP